MPWNSEGGGGNQGPWGQGPWGQGGGGGTGGPKRPNPPGRGPTPPDLDDLIRQSQDKLKQVLPTGGGYFGWVLALGLVALFVVYNSVYQVQPDERGVVLRFGTFDRVAEPGLHFALWPVETMEKPRVGAVRQINIGNDGTEGQMLTSDKNIIGVPFSVFWRINDAKSYLFNVADQERTIRSVAQSAMREVAGQTRAQAILTTGKNAVEAQVMEITQKLLDEYGAGVTITSVNLGDVQPPREGIFHETMEQILGQTNKVILEQGANGQGVVPYLPLPEVKARQGEQQN